MADITPALILMPMVSSLFQERNKRKRIEGGLFENNVYKRFQLHKGNIFHLRFFVRYEF